MTVKIYIYNVFDVSIHDLIKPRNFIHVAVVSCEIY